MNWSDEQQARFDELRRREGAKPLSRTNRQELALLTAGLTHTANDA